MIKFLKKSQKITFFLLIIILSSRDLNALEKKNSEINLILEKIKNQIEELDIKINKINNEIENIKLNKNLENKENTKDYNESLKFNENPNYPILNQSEELDVLDEENDENYQNTSSSLMSLNLKKNNLNNSSITKIEDLYFESMEKFRSNNFDESELLLEKILNTSWDKSEKTTEIQANSYFLIAEIFYKKPDFEKSASNFLKAYQIFSKINKNHVQAGNSLLRLGQTLYESGNKNAACKSFIKLNSDFKNSNNSLSEISENEISRLKCIIK